MPADKTINAAVQSEDAEPDTGDAFYEPGVEPGHGPSVESTHIAEQLDALITRIEDEGGDELGPAHRFLQVRRVE